MKKIAWIVLISIFVIVTSIFANYFLAKSSVKIVPFEEAIFPVYGSDLKNIDYFSIFTKVTSHKETRDFMNGDLKLKFNKDNQPSHKLHHMTFELYERGFEIIRSDKNLRQLYDFLITEEIIGLSQKSNIDGIIDELAYSMGRDYIYQQTGPNIQFIMEDLDQDGIKIIQELLNYSPEKRKEILEKNMSFIELMQLTPDDAFTKDSALALIVKVTLYLDIRLGLLMMDTNFEQRANTVAVMAKKRLRIEAKENHKQRRDKLNRQLDQLLQSN